MSKLGYTWYPKDWNNSESVFELSLEQRGLFRELIDLAMLNDNKTVINMSVWCRKWDVEENCLEGILGRLISLDLINIDGKNLFIPSCESRLNLVRGGKKGGEKSKPVVKPIPKPIDKPDSNQKKLNIKEKETILDYLNLKNNSTYRSTSSSTDKLLNLRASEGFTVDDFKIVIDNKVFEWKHDSKMSKFLRPETLFGNKFEGYLNEKPKRIGKPISEMTTHEILKLR